MTIDRHWPPELVSLYQEQRTGFVRLAYLMIGHHEVAEEVVQEAFLACAPHWLELERPTAYLRTAVVNRARSWLRRLRLERERDQATEVAVEMHPDELWDALGRLDERRRIAIVLRFYDDRPDAEIAEILDCKPATVRTLIHRGLHDLRREVQR